MHILGEALLDGLLPEVGEIARGHGACADLSAELLALADLLRVVLGARLIEARHGVGVAGLFEVEGAARLLVRPGVAVGAVAVDQADLLVGGDGVPHVREHGGHGLDAHAQSVRPVEGTGLAGSFWRPMKKACHGPWIMRPGVPMASHTSPAGFMVSGAPPAKHDVHLVVLDEVARHLRAAVGIGLRVHGEDLTAASCRHRPRRRRRGLWSTGL